MPLLINWTLITWDRSGTRLEGNVYNDSRFPDGERITTSPIVSMTSSQVQTRNTVYDLAHTVSQPKEIDECAN